MELSVLLYRLMKIENLKNKPITIAGKLSSKYPLTPSFDRGQQQIQTNLELGLLCVEAC